MAAKEKVDIKRTDQFQEMEEALSKAIEDLDTTMDRVSALFEGGEQSELALGGAGDGKSETGEAEPDQEEKPDTVTDSGDNDVRDDAPADGPQREEDK